MKTALTIVIFLLACTATMVQTDIATSKGTNSSIKIRTQTDTSVSKPKILSRCTPSRGQIINPPLYLVFSDKKQLLSTKSTGAMSQVNPRDIQSINVLKGADALKKYGEDGQYGVVETYLKRGKHLIKNYKPQPVDTLTRYRR